MCEIQTSLSEIIISSEREAPKSRTSWPRQPSPASMRTPPRSKQCRWIEAGARYLEGTAHPVPRKLTSSSRRPHRHSTGDASVACIVCCCVVCCCVFCCCVVSCAAACAELFAALGACAAAISAAAPSVAPSVAALCTFECPQFCSLSARDPPLFVRGPCFSVRGTSLSAIAPSLSTRSTSLAIAPLLVASGH